VAAVHPDGVRKRQGRVGDKGRSPNRNGGKLDAGSRTKGAGNAVRRCKTIMHIEGKRCADTTELVGASGSHRVTHIILLL
jgi:hypothetical protein